MKKVHLTYFKGSGKYYCEGEYESEHQLDFYIYSQVRDFNILQKLPGLSTGRWEGYILVVPEDGVPALLVR